LTNPLIIIIIAAVSFRFPIYGHFHSEAIMVKMTKAILVHVTLEQSSLPPTGSMIMKKLSINKGKNAVRMTYNNSRQWRMVNTTLALECVVVEIKLLEFDTTPK
jgi:hypothetical protein